MPTPLPPDEVLLETALAESIRETILKIGIPGPTTPVVIPANVMPKVYSRPRFADTDEEDVKVSAIPDPVNREDRVRTHIIEVGIPVVSERPYAGWMSTVLDFTYPISYELEVVDDWDNANNALLFTNSTALFKAVYMRARRQFKLNHDLGFENASHTYLQQVSAVTATDEETGGRLHLADWSLTVQVTSILV